MPGFFITNVKQLLITDNEVQKNCRKDSIENECYVIQRNTLEKYMDDKLFFEDEHWIVLLDGVILNKKELIEEYRQKTWRQTVLHMMRADPDFFFASFRGSFSGAVLNKSSDTWRVFTDHIGSHPLYYYCADRKFVIGSEMRYLREALISMGVQREPDMEVVKYLSTYGFTLDERTILKNVYRLLPGCCAWVKKGSILTEIYERVDNTPNDCIKSEEAIEQMDYLFRRSVKRVFEKDREYGYRTLVDISGGLDSRAIHYVASDMGYADILALCFAQTGSREQIIAEEILRDLRVESLFYALDSASHLYDIDQIIRMNNGTCYYAGIGGYKRILETLDFTKTGLAVSGIFGDIYEGAYLFSETEGGYKKATVNEREHCASRRLKIHLDEKCTEGFSNIESFLSYKRDMIANMNTCLVKQNYTEVAVPFGDIDFLKLFFSLPLKMRVEDHICVRWMKKKYHRSMEFVYARTGLLPDANKWKCCTKKYIERVGNKARRILGQNVCDRRTMNPFDYWYSTNNKLKIFMQNYYKDNAKYANQWNLIREYVDELFLNGNMMEKLQALGVISMLKQYIEE